MFQRLEAVVVFLVHRERIHLGNAGKNTGNERLVHMSVLAILAVHLHPRASLVNQVDGLVGQVTVGDVAGTAGDSEFQRIIVIGHPMERLITLLEHLHNPQRLVNARFLDGHLLEAAHQATVAHDVAVVFLIGGRSDKPHSPALQIRFQQVAGIHRALTRLSSSHDIVDFVDVEDGSLLGGDTVHHRLEAFLKVTTILSAGNQGAQVQLVDLDTAQCFRHIAVLDALRQAIDDTGLAHTRLTDVQRVVLILAAQHLNGAVEFIFPSDEGIMVRQMVIDAQHIVAPASRNCLLFNRLLLCFRIIGPWLVLIVRRVKIKLAQRLKEITLVFIADEQMQAICGIGLLQVHHLMNQVIDIGRPDLCIAAKQHQGSHQLLILVGKSDDRLGVIFRDALHAVYPFAQLLNDIIDKVIGCHIGKGRPHLAVVEGCQQDMLRGNQLVPVYAGKNRSIGQQSL